jgi:hypothetical protein
MDSALELAIGGPGNHLDELAPLDQRPRTATVGVLTRRGESALLEARATVEGHHEPQHEGI